MSPLFALAPLIACATLPAARTAVFAVAAFAAAVGSGIWNDNSGSPQHLVRLIDVALIGAAAVVVAAVRVRRERQLGRLTALAEVAQRAVLPVLPAHARSADIAVRYQAAGEDTLIGGDLYDCYHSRTHTRFLLGDVRGKGMGAVEQAARVIRAFRQAAAIQPSLEAVADDMTSYLNPFFEDEEFVTALLLDTTDATRARLVNAGHPPPLLVRPDGECTFLETERRPSARARRALRLPRVRLAPWGPAAALHRRGERGPRQQRRIPRSARARTVLVGTTVEAALDGLLDAVREHAARGELSDDVAVLLLEHTVAGSDYRPSTAEHDWRTSLPK